MLDSELGDEFGGVVSAVVDDDGGELAQGAGECGHGERFFAGGVFCLVADGLFSRSGGNTRVL